RTEELEASVNYTLPQKYLYEPNKSILKAGAFKSLALRLGLDKLHPNSHLYTSDKNISFPGRVFEIMDVVPYQKKLILKALPDRKANITTRNFPDTVETIRKKTGIVDGGSIFLFATTNRDGKLIVLVCKKVI